MVRREPLGDHTTQRSKSRPNNPLISNLEFREEQIENTFRSSFSLPSGSNNLIEFPRVALYPIPDSRPQGDCDR